MDIKTEGRETTKNPVSKKLTGFIYTTYTLFKILHML